MVNRCPNCGGLLNYDIPTGQLKCESCDSLFDPEAYADNTAATEPTEYSVNLFTCPNCGGSISSNEAEAVEYCLYCGSFVTLTSQIEKVNKPNFIIPFSKTKEECIKSYSSMIRRKLYAPKQFRDEKFLSGFKGIYIPYWTYSYEFGPDIKLDAVKESRQGNYILKQHFDVNCHSEGQLDGVSFDASSTFDDEISSRISPFNSKDFKPFKSTYMFGFYGDTADIDSAVYKDDAGEVARDEMWDRVSKEVNINEGTLERPSTPNAFNNTFKIKERAYLSMLPVWFLTWRNKNKVAYSVVNGNTGTIYSEIPVDTKRYLLFSLLFAIPIFLCLNLAFTFTATNMLAISAILSLFMMMLYSFQLDKIVRKKLHADDKGYTTVDRVSRKEAEKVTMNIVVEAFKGIGGLFTGIGFGGLLFVVVLIFLLSSWIFWGGLAFGIFAIIYSMVRIGKNSKILRDKSVWLDVIWPMIALFISILMLIADPAGDEFYYITALVCIAGVGLSAICTMRRYNELVTRPVPHFFDRKAGGEV